VVWCVDLSQVIHKTYDTMQWYNVDGVRNIEIYDYSCFVIINIRLLSGFDSCWYILKLLAWLVMLSFLQTANLFFWQIVFVIHFCSGSSHGSVFKSLDSTQSYCHAHELSVASGRTSSQHCSHAPKKSHFTHCTHGPAWKIWHAG